MKDVKVSVIVPIYNVEKYLPKLLESLVNQTYSNIEIILVEDGSPDRCAAICDEYASHDDRIIVVHKINAGGCQARNSGIDKATGDYIMFVDGDDWLSYDCVEYLLNLALSTNSEMSLSKRHFTSRDLEDSKVENDKIETWSSAETIVAIFLPLFAVGCWNKLYKTELIRKNNLRFNIPWYGEGLYFCSMAASFANHVGVGNKKVYYYRKNNPNSATTVFKVANARNAIWNTRNIRKKITVKTRETTWAINQHLRNNYYEALKILYASLSIRKNLLFFIACWTQLILYTPLVIIEGNYSRRERFSLWKHCLFPFRYIKSELTNAQINFERDKIL